MLFNSFEFAVFLASVVALYWASRHSLRIQNCLLLVASYCFYGFWDWRFLSLIAFSTTVDYLIANRISAIYAQKTQTSGLQEHSAAEPVALPADNLKAQSSASASGSSSDPSAIGSEAVELNRQALSDQGRAKRLLLVSLVCNLGLLGIFKYFNFFVDSFIVLGAQFGLNLDTPTLRLLPPVGISFYTFQSMAYSIDVYRRQLSAERNFFTFALYISYFPQLVAGPIERASRLLPQFRQARVVTADCIKSALALILIGLFKKVVIADNAGVHVNRIFGNIEEQGSLSLIAGGIFFTLQIYGDFSGYSNMARGMSRLLGIRLIENFKTPYLSANISEFWRRWHISLSQWLRDYLYIPLGGSHKGSFATHRNLMLTMLLGGLWHGAAWTFVIWGLLNGLYLVAHRWCQDKQTRRVQQRTLAAIPLFLSWLCSVALTYSCVMIAFIVFRADSLSDAIDYLQGMMAFRGGLPVGDFLRIGLLAALLAPLELVQYTRNDRLLAVRELVLPARVVLYTMMVLGLLLASSTDVPFIYFQF